MGVHQWALVIDIEENNDERREKDYCCVICDGKKKYKMGHGTSTGDGRIKWRKNASTISR